MRTLFALTLIATPAAAETWDCRMAERCDTGARCVELTDERASLTIADDGMSGHFKAGPENTAMVRMRDLQAVRAFTVHLEGQALGIVVLSEDGVLTTSAHLFREGRGVISGKGICTRTDG